MADLTPAPTPTPFEIPTSIPQLKTGIKTTEFWFSLAAAVMSQLYAQGILGNGGTVATVAGTIATVLTVLGYTVSRASSKSTHTEATATLAIAKANNSLPAPAPKHATL